MAKWREVESSNTVALALLPPVCYCPDTLPLILHRNSGIIMEPDYAQSDRPISELSTTTAFNTGIDERDVFLGRMRCVVCGVGYVLEYCHVLPRHEMQTVCQIDYIPPFSEINTGHSGKTLRTAVGCLHRPKIPLNMNHEMAS